MTEMMLTNLPQFREHEVSVMSRRPARIVRFFPMLCVQAFITFTVALFVGGPWPWPISNPHTLYSFLFCAQLALLLGYTLSISKKRPTVYTGHWSWQRLFNVSLVLSLIWILPNFINRLGLDSLSLDEIFQKIILGLTDPGDAYVKRLALEKEMDNTGGVIAYLTILASPFLQMLVPIGLTFWKSLTLWKKRLLVFWLVVDIFTWVASGTNKGIADLLFLMPIYFIVRNPNFIAKFNVLRFAILTFVLAIGFYVFLVFFSLGMESRPGSASKIGADYTIGIKYDDSNFILKALPENVRGGVASFSSYLTQGYYGLSLCLDEPFTWSYGLGHSYYLPSWYKKIDPTTDVAMQSYPGRVSITNNWGYFDRWHSIYPWLASDVTFPGTIVVMFFLGSLFAKVWLDILWCRNPLAIVLFGMMLIMFFYVSANNQILGFPTSSASFWVLLIWWCLTRRTLSKVKYGKAV